MAVRIFHYYDNDNDVLLLRNNDTQKYAVMHAYVE